MEDVGLGGLVWSNGSHLDTVLSVGGTSVGETWSDDGHWVVSALHDQHSDELLDTVDDEVATHLVGLLLVLDEVVWGHVVQVASVGLQHDGETTTVSDLGEALLTVVHGPLQFEQQLALVGAESLSGLSWENLALNGSGDTIVGHWLSDGNLLNTDGKLVTQVLAVDVVWIGALWLTVEDDLLTDVLNTEVQQTTT